MRIKLIVLAVAIAGLAQGQSKTATYPVTFHVPVQVRNIPSDINNVAVECRISTPSKNWGASSPVPLGAGRYDGTITVVLNLPEPLPYDAKWGCSLKLSNSFLDVLESIRSAHPDPAFPKVINVHGTFS